MAEDLAQRIAFAVENARTYRLVRQERDQLKHVVKAECLSIAALGRLATSDAIGIATIEGESIIEANDAFLRLVGYETSDLLAGNLSWWDMTPPEYRSMDVHGFAELLARGVCTPFEKECLRQDGSRVPVLIGAALLDREPLRRVCFVVDLSARHELEQAHLEFMRTIGSDLITPITVTRWTSQLLGGQGWSGQPVADPIGHSGGKQWADHEAKPDDIQRTAGCDATPAWPGSGGVVKRERVRRFGRGKRRRLPGMGVD